MTNACVQCGATFDRVRVNQLYCGPTCRRLARNVRRMSVSPISRPVFRLGALGSRHGAHAIKQVDVHAELTIGLLVWCPYCPAVMAAGPDATRCCPSCGSTASLNVEEVGAIQAGYVA